MKIGNLWIGFALGSVFFICSFLTLNHYGISWDEPTHFKRGQAYFYYFITGEKDYKKLPEYDLVKARADKTYHQRSLYQEDTFSYNYYLINDGGHPPLNGELAAFFNVVFYQKLGLLSDIESYHLFEILLSSILVIVIYLFASETIGIFGGFISTIFLATYPLFWAESHFNIKDPVETTFFSICVFFFWKAINLRKIRFFLYSSFLAGLAFGTKFNVLFLPFILGPWLISLILIPRLDFLKFLFRRQTLLTLSFFPVIMFAILFITWPYLWSKPITNFLSVIQYYKEIGTSEHFQTNYLVSSWNTYPIKWIIFTTQPVLLIFFGFGLLLGARSWRKNNNFFLLWLLWFLVPILRVSMPSLSLYGGIRQIMEYIPAMCLIAGIGSQGLFDLIFSRVRQKAGRVYLYLTCSIIFLIVTLIPIFYNHPNENVYFNFLTKGLSGATKKNFPAAGNSFGNAYKQGVDWINDNVEPGAKLALVQGTILNIPLSEPRPDIRYSNTYWSGIDRKGEYLIELTYNYDVKVYFYAWEYVEKMLNPVYQVKVDSIPILQIWKNDLSHTKKEYQKKEELYSGEMTLIHDGSSLFIKLPSVLDLSRLRVKFESSKSCNTIKQAFIETSLNFKDYVREKDFIPQEQLPGIKSLTDDQLLFFFASRKAAELKIVTDYNESCILINPKVEITTLVNE